MGHVDSLGGPMMPLKMTCIDKDYVSFRPVLTVKSLKAYWTGRHFSILPLEPLLLQDSLSQSNFVFTLPIPCPWFLIFLGMRQQS